MNFSSENYDSVHPAIFDSLIRSNRGFAPSYGKDSDTAQLIAYFEDILKQKDISLFCCFNGSGANNFALSAMTQPYDAIFCSDVSHLYTAESTTPEALTGCRLYAIRSVMGKIDTGDLLSHLNRRQTVHTPVGFALSITQPTEYGTVYSADELKAIAAICWHYGLRLHIDGARIFNALEAMGCSLQELLQISCADAITIGGTKSGLMFGETVLFLSSSRFRHLDLLHKRSTQLASKSRFIATQFNTLLANGLWKEIAGHTNSLAKYFAAEINKLGPDLIAYPVETNVVFVKMQREVAIELQREAAFYIWNEEKGETRFIFSAGNTNEEIDQFIGLYSELNETLLR